MKIPEDFDIEARAQKARQNFLDGYNCCQAVMLAFSDIFGIDEKTVATIASGFGGGMARMREVCGTVTAMGMAAGFISPAIQPKNMAERTANYALAVELIESVDGGKNWEKSRVVICQELPYGGAPRVALVYDDTNDLRYYEGPQSVLESIEKQDAMRGDAESLLSEYYPIADEAERQDLAHWFGNQPTVEYALRASFENYRFDAASGYLVKLYTDSINSPIGALLPAVLYDYGNGEVYFKLLY